MQSLTEEERAVLEKMGALFRDEFERSANDFESAVEAVEKMRKPSVPDVPEMMPELDFPGETEAAGSCAATDDEDDTVAFGKAIHSLRMRAMEAQVEAAAKAKVEIARAATIVAATGYVQTMTLLKQQP